MKTKTFLLLAMLIGAYCWTVDRLFREEGGLVLALLGALIAMCIVSILLCLCCLWYSTGGGNYWW